MNDDILDILNTLIKPSPSPENKLLNDEYIAPTFDLANLRKQLLVLII